MPTQSTQRDAGLIRDIEPLAVQDYDFLRYSNDRSIKDAFLYNGLTEPGFVYHDVDIDTLNEREANLSVLNDVVAVYDDACVRRAYLPKLREIREKYELIRAAYTGDDAAALDASLRLYGKPRLDLFEYARAHLRERLRFMEGEHPVDARIRAAMDTLWPLVAHMDDTAHAFSHITLPSPRTYTSKHGLSASELQTLFTQAFERYGVTGWRAVVDAPGERVTFDTNHELRTVFIPHDEDIALRKFPLTRERIEAIIAHEVGTHVVRRERGSRSALALLGIGLAGYLRGEEGVATYAEQTCDGARHFAGILGYLAVGWAIGIDGTPRTFRGLYQVLEPYLLLSSIEHALRYGEEYDLDLLTVRARRAGWARAVRTFRGTTGTTPGACFTKDIVYLEGNVAIWELVTRDPTSEQYFSLGKYDPANEEHVALLQDLHIR